MPSISRGFQFLTQTAFLPKHALMRQLALKAPRSATGRAPPIPPASMDKTHPTGEDAFAFVDTPTHTVLGVADGVGGWAESGVDPADLSRSLMQHVEHWAKLSSKSPMGSTTPNTITMDPTHLLSQAFGSTCSSGQVQAGGTTACILSLCKATGSLESANLGDSGFLIIRDGQRHFLSKAQQHYFNCPYQLTILPYPISKKDQANMDHPGKADRKDIQLEPGDLILLATDGFWDNVPEEETLDYLSQHSPSLGNLSTLANSLVKAASTHSQNPRFLSPWAKGAREAGHRGVLGGKIDDITLQLVHVQRD